jgi:hypothetical protein
LIVWELKTKKVTADSGFNGDLGSEIRRENKQSYPNTSGNYAGSLCHFHSFSLNGSNKRPLEMTTIQLWSLIEAQGKSVLVGVSHDAV